MRKLKGFIPTTILVAVIAFGATFANAGTDDQKPCANDKDGVILNGVILNGVILNSVGVILNAGPGVILNGVILNGVILNDKDCQG